MTSTVASCPEREGEVELGGVVAEVRDADLAVLDVVDDTRFASVDAGEGEPAEDAFRAERGGEPLLDAEAVHEGEHARLGREAGADKGGCVVKGGGLEAAEHPVDGADGGRVAGYGGAFEGEVALVRLDAEAALGDGVVVAAEEKAHVVPGLREASAVVGADRPGADDGYCGHRRRS